MRLQRTVEPALEPITLEDLKAFLRIDSSDEDALLNSLISEARSIVETQTKRALLRQTWVARYERISCPNRVAIPRPPLQTFTSLEYLDEDEIWQTVDAADYRIDNDDDQPAQLTLKEYPEATVYDAEVYPWRATFVAGGESAAEIPRELVSCVRVIAAALYGMRCGDTTRGEEKLFNPETTFGRILRPWRVIYV